MRKLFNKYDQDGSGDIDAKEFQLLAFDLGGPSSPKTLVLSNSQVCIGLVLTEVEATNCLKEVAGDGTGKAFRSIFKTRRQPLQYHTLTLPPQKQRTSSSS